MSTCKAIFGAIGPKVHINIDTFVKIGSRDLTSFGDKKVIFLNFLKVALDLFRSCLGIGNVPIDGGRLGNGTLGIAENWFKNFLR